MYLAENKTLRLITLCGFYVAQGLPWGFVTVAMKSWLAGGEFQMSEQDLGDLVAYAALPWSFKWIWGFVVDSYQTSPMGKRRPWLIFAQVVMLAALGSMFFITDFTANFKALLYIVLIANIFVGLQDVSVDAMAVDLLTDDDRERVSGFMYGSSYVGTALGGAGLGWVIAHYGIRSAMACQCALLALSITLPIMFRERRGDRMFGFKRLPVPPEALGSGVEVPKDDYGFSHSWIYHVTKDRPLLAKMSRHCWTLASDLFVAFTLKSTFIGAIVALLVKIGYGIVSPKFTIYMRNAAGWTMEEYTNLEGLWGSIFGFTACCLGAIAAQKFGAKKITAIGLLALSALWIVVGLSPELLGDDRIAAAVVVGQESFLGLITVGLFAIYLAISSPKVAAIQFTAYMSMLNFSYSMGSKLAGGVGEYLNLGQMFVLAAVIQASLIIGVGMIDVGESRRLLAAEGERPEESEPPVEG